MDPIIINLALGLISSYSPKITDKIFRKSQKIKDTMHLRVYAEKGEKSSSLGTAYVGVIAYSNYPVTYKIRVSLKSDRINSLDIKREAIDIIETMHHLAEDRNEQRFAFARPLPEVYGPRMKEPLKIEIMKEDGTVITTEDLYLEYES